MNLDVGVGEDNIASGALLDAKIVGLRKPKLV
jgi:hypothetical protein